MHCASHAANHNMTIMCKRIGHSPAKKDLFYQHNEVHTLMAAIKDLERVISQSDILHMAMSLSDYLFILIWMNYVDF